MNCKIFRKYKIELGQKKILHFKIKFIHQAPLSFENKKYLIFPSLENSFLDQGKCRPPEIDVLSLVSADNINEAKGARVIVATMGMIELKIKRQDKTLWCPTTGF